MSLKSSQLIRFTPGDHAPGAVTPVERLSVTLAVRLDGLTMTSTTGERLHALLTIPFAPQGLCSRARLVGISPMGHAPLVLTYASYKGTTCRYAGPAEGNDPFLVYSDYPYTEADQGATLVIDWPAENLFPYFKWPGAIIEFDPPLDDDAVSPFEAAAPMRELLDAHNAVRGALGLSILSWNSRLARTVADHGQWLFATYPGECDGSVVPAPDWNPHLGVGDNVTPGARAWGDGYPNTSAVGENLGLRSLSVAAMMKNWLNSAIHYDNLTDPRWRVMGAARLQIPTLQEGRYFFGVMFGEIYIHEEDEIDEPNALELVSLTSLSPPAVDADPGVQLPMRLVATVPGKAGETEIKTLNYQDAPGFTGAGENVRSGLSPAWSLPSAELATALAAVPNDDPDQPLDIELYWRIYHGSGEMLYHVMCDGSAIPEPYADRRNAGIGGGFGTFMTTDLLAARVLLKPAPHPFLLFPVDPGEWSVCARRVIVLDAYGKPLLSAIAPSLIDTASPGTCEVSMSLVAIPDTAWIGSLGWVENVFTNAEYGQTFLGATDPWEPPNPEAQAPLLSLSMDLPRQVAAIPPLTSRGEVATTRAAGGSPTTLNTSGEVRDFSRLDGTGRSAWVSGETIITWDGPFVYLGEHEVLALETRVLCACLVKDSDGVDCVQALTDGGTAFLGVTPAIPGYHGALWRRRLQCGATVARVARGGLPSVGPDVYTRWLPAPRAYQFSPDGKKILTYVQPMNAAPAAYPDLFPWAVWEAEIIESEWLVEIGPWVTLATGSVRDSTQLSVEFADPYSTLVGAAEALMCAFYDGQTPVVRIAKASFRGVITGTVANATVEPLSLQVLDNDHSVVTIDHLSASALQAPSGKRRALFPAVHGPLHHFIVTDNGVLGTRRVEWFIAGDAVDEIDCAMINVNHLPVWRDRASATEVEPFVNAFALRHELYRCLAEAIYNDGVERPYRNAYSHVVSDYRYFTQTYQGATLAHAAFLDVGRTVGVGISVPDALKDKTLADLHLISARPCALKADPATAVSESIPSVSSQLRAILGAINARRAVAACQPVVWNGDLCVAAGLASLGVDLTAALRCAGYAQTLTAASLRLQCPAQQSIDEVAALLLNAWPAVLSAKLIHFGGYRSSLQVDDVAMYQWDVYLGGQDA